MMGDGSVAAVQAECDRRLHVLNHDSSPTTSFEYLQWALSLLRHFHHQEDRLGGDEAGNGEPAVSQLGKRKAESEPSIAEDEDGTEMDTLGVASSPSHANDVSTSDGMKCADADGNVESLEEAVRRADSGKAGIRMAQIVGIWIGRRQCHALVHLISQCLCKSLNQVSPFSKSDEEGGVESSLWLHNWLVREVMQNNSSTHRSPLDWLIAHLTAASPSLFLGPVINDLWENVITSRASAMVSLSFYVRRIGILEYAALRGSEQVAVELERIFSNMGFVVGSVEGERRTDAHDKKRVMEMWSMWLGIATLCPKFLAACCRHWIPYLTVRLLESYGSLFVDVIDMGSPLTPLWFMLEGVNHEEPTRLSVWLSAILSRRICELAAVGTSLVVLLNRLVGKKDKLEKGVLEIATSLLQRLHMDLSVRILPCVLGTEQTVGAEPLSFTTENEYTGYSLFIDNLKTNLKKLWLELLSGCSESFSAAQSVPSNKDLKQSASEPIAGVSGWWNGDPFVGVCRITILSSGHNAVAQLLAEETVAGRSDNGGLDAKSVTKLFFVMEVMKMVAGQGRGVQVFELWSQLCVAAFNKSDDKEAFQRALAVKQLLEPAFWQSHQTERSSDAGNASEGGVSWKVVWMLLRTVMDSQWLHLVPLLHRKNSWELHLVVLQILQSLSPGSDTHSQAVVVRLKALLGIFFQLVDESHENVEAEDLSKWLRMHVLEHLKRVTVQQASSSFASFTVLVSSLLDYSFERSDRSLDKKFQRRGAGANGRGTSTLVPGRLDQNGSFTLVSLPASKESTSSLASPKFSLTEENRRIKSAGLPSLGKDTRFGSIRRREDGARPAFQVSKDDVEKQEMADTTILELGDVLRRTAGSAVLRAAEDSDIWSPHPAFILASQMIDRLGTPHELAMTMEQYEEVLPKQVSTPRHIFLTECFGRNPLLFEMLELVVKYKNNNNNNSDEVVRCVEFIRVLLVDSISRWHSAYRTRRAPGLPPPRVFLREEKLDRMHVIRLINLVADAGWLPQPLASTIEIIEVIDGADVADLLLLVWRCMHHAMSFGTKSWGGNSPPVLPPSEKAAQNQVTEGGSGRDGAYTEWEGHLFAILRQNIAHIGAHFAQVYPKPDTL